MNHRSAYTGMNFTSPLIIRQCIAHDKIIESLPTDMISNNSYGVGGAMGSRISQTLVTVPLSNSSFKKSKLQTKLSMNNCNLCEYTALLLELLFKIVEGMQHQSNSGNTNNSRRSTFCTPNLPTASSDGLKVPLNELADMYEYNIYTNEYKSVQNINSSSNSNSPKNRNRNLKYYRKELDILDKQYITFLDGVAALQNIDILKCYDIHSLEMLSVLLNVYHMLLLHRYIFMNCKLFFTYFMCL